MDIEKAVKYMTNIANDDSHGYAQDNRGGNPDFDCSSLVGTALNNAGFNVSKLSTTRNLYEQLINCGFKEVSINCSRKRGDIFLTPGKHVVMCVDENNIVHASINENGKTTNGKIGDQTGKEICIRSFYNPSYGWKYHLRYEQPCQQNKNTSLVVDISHHNTITNFDIMAQEVFGTIIRVGYRGYSNGKITLDNLFVKHATELTKRNVNIGLYFFSQAISEEEAIEEAKYVLSIARSYKLYYPIFIDSEYSNKNHNGRADGLSKAKRTQITVAFCEEIKRNGYIAGVYASENWFINQLDFNQLNNYFIWVAKYSNNKPTTSRYEAWQYGSSNFSWATAPIDVNHWYFNVVVDQCCNTQLNKFENIVKVNTHLNIRNKPVSGDIVGKLSNGDKVNVIGYQKGWLQIGTNKWVSEMYVTSTRGIVDVNSSLNVRTGAGTNYTSIGKLKRNATVKIVNESNGWYQIITSDGLFGWASNQYIDII